MFGQKNKKEQIKIIVTVSFLAVAAIAPYAFHSLIHNSLFFIQLFYIPIIFAALWWKRKGILVALFLGANLLFSHLFYELNAADVISSLLFVLVAVFISELGKRTARAEEETQACQSNMGQIFDAAGNGLRVIDKEFNMIQWNKAFLALTGLKGEDILGKKCYEIFSCPHCNTTDCTLKRIIAGEERVECDMEKERLNGQRLFCTITATPLHAQSGDLIGIVEDIKDITDRRQAEESLKKSEEQYRLFLKNIKGIAYQTDMNYSPHFFLGALEQITGYTEEELIAGMPRWDHIIHKDDLPGIYNNSKRYCKLPCHSCLPYEQEYRIVRKDGQIRWVRENIQHACDKAGNPQLIEGILYDITDRKEAEKALKDSEERFLQAQKMEAIGRLAGGIAHDFNNILTIIMGNCGLLLDKVKGDNPIHNDIEEIYKAGERASSLTSQILSFGRRQLLQPKVLDINQVITEIQNLLRRLIGEDIKLITILQQPPLRVKVDQGQLGQVIMNLAVNARDAMPNGGTFIIKTAGVILDEEHCNVFPDAHPGSFVRISVEDTGTGIEKGILDKIFEPYFTTKKKGQGTGLGLSTAYGIIKQHEGWISVYSHPGYGATFEIYLPALTERLPEKQKEAVSLHTFHGLGERILLVEDDEGVRRFTKKVLSENGYTVFEAATALDALTLFDRENGYFHLVISDVVLPDLNGIQLVDRLLAKNHELLVLMCSGYSYIHTQWSEISKRGLAFIKKPYNSYELLEVVKDATNGNKAMLRNIT